MATEPSSASPSRSLPNRSNGSLSGLEYRGTSELLFPFSVALSEEVAFIPRRSLCIVGNQVPAQKHESPVLGGLIEQESRLFHIIPGLVIPLQFPFLEDRLRTDLGIVGFESWHGKDGGDSLLHEGVLIAADKNGLVRPWVRP